MLTPIFIGGTGRSGTTILSKVLGRHPDCFALPIESRFITDPDGLISLYKSLYPDWSFFQSDKAFERFLRLMRHLKFPYKGKYVPYGIEQYLNEGVYEKIVSEYCENLKVQVFKSAWLGRVNISRKIISKFSQVIPFSNALLEDSYYVSPPEENEFCEFTGSFITDCFEGFKDRRKADLVIDHTPSNIVHANTILKFLPESKFIHIYRNPLDIISSFHSKDWGSRDLEINTCWIFDTLNQWFKHREVLNPTSFLEVKFEDLIADPEKELNLICDFLRINESQEFYKVDLSKHNIGRWVDQISNEEANMILTKYGNVFKKLGYKIDI